MVTVGEWVQGARPRTLPNAVAPVLAGTGAAIGAGGFQPVGAVLALVVALGMIIGVNYSNDYSDGVRGTDDNRVGPLRLVGSGTAEPATVRTAAFVSFGIACLAGLVLVALTGHWWLIALGAACVLGAWFYTGGSRPYGYRGLGEVAVFVFFGPVAVLGTVYVQSGPPGAPAVLAAVGVGMLSCSVLVANNLRDIPTDTQSGKRTLAVALGDRRTRLLYATLVAIPFLFSLLAGVLFSPWLLLGLLAAPLAVVPVRTVLGGATGPKLIPVLGASGIVMLAWAIGTGVGLALS
ncbi:1,4-dihydroxy-2-naphthoate polyprenyltransferase [Pseudonocardia eucalypti]|uniref:1,4-dihydroxy-2-naphthoate octaprenyltransferase n=1 Tax=Pseudonocardia eucalypti TaxID=648755 RepID=A0ABP9Q1Y6_9PSEU|nr:1,4-dihydroxy-2-naphthoate octaprenyltransferase [Pseudonocardia eucalypti]